LPWSDPRAAAGARLAAVALTGALLVGCATAEPRPERTIGDLVTARRADDKARGDEIYGFMEKLLRRAERKAATAKAGKAGARPTIDVLIICGGGDWGAFGAGVLKGWARVTGELARPQFDVVTGVSTGALIAPFAFLGDDRSIDRIVQLYRDPQPDTAVSRGFLFFLPNNPSFYVLPGLERELKTALDRSMIERIAATDGSGRGLIVNTTNIDFGDMHVWDLVAEARKSLSNNDDDHLRTILLASAGVPAIFPARDIGEHLYVDGAITGNILYGGRAREEETFPALWSARHPGIAMPRMRFWVIFNNQFRFPPQVTQDRWPDIMSRATIMATQTSTINSMRHLFAMAEIAKLKRKAEMEVRVMAVPDSWVPPKPGTFVKEVMNELADLGEKMGADPASWRTEAP
jgi:predicted acylesterase/phospholipase RssA